MALLRRYGIYTLATLAFLYFYYSLTFPYQPDGPPKENPSQLQRPQRYKSFNWSKVPIKNRVSSYIPLPTSAPSRLPRIQHDFSRKKEDSAAKEVREKRKAEIRKQFLKCWRSYRSYGWMHDELRPISGEVTDQFGGWATMLIDALDTAYIMGFDEEFSSAIADVERIDFGYTHLDKINVFETNVRHLGGLLSAYELSSDKRLLNKAKEVGEMLYRAFDTPNHMPITRWDFRAAGEGKPQLAHDQVLLAEIGSFTMEFTRLSQLTGDPKWYDAGTRITRLLDEQQSKTKLPGMWPIVVSGKQADFTKDTGFTLSAMADSVYEYFGKMYVLLAGRDAIYRKLYEASLKTAAEKILFRPSLPGDPDVLVSGFVRVDDSNEWLDTQIQQLGCHAGGMYALGGRIFQKDEHVTIGRKLTDMCVWAYRNSPTGIMPEVAHLLQCKNTTSCSWSEKAWHEQVIAKAVDVKEQDPLKNIASLRLAKGFTAIDDRRYVLRPEAIESVFVLYRLTGDQHWQAAAWDMWTAIQKSTDTDLGNSALRDVSEKPPPRLDSMESYWLGESLKYFYLIFSEPDLISLDDWVLNTKAHPFRIPKPGAKGK